MLVGFHFQLNKRKLVRMRCAELSVVPRQIGETAEAATA